MLRILRPLLVSLAVSLVTAQSFGVTAFGVTDDPKIVGYIPGKNRLAVLQFINEERESQEIRWYDDGNLIHRMDAVAGATFFVDGVEQHAVLNLTQNENSQGELVLTVLDSEFTPIKSRTFLAELANFFLLDEMDYRITVLGDGSFVIEESFGYTQHIIVSADLSSFRIMILATPGQLISLTETEFTSLTDFSRNRFLAGCRASGCHDMDDSDLQFVGDFQAFTVKQGFGHGLVGKNKLLDQIDFLYGMLPRMPGYGADSSDYCEHFFLLDRPTGTAESRARLVLDTIDMRFWYTLSCVPRRDPLSTSVLELQCMMQAEDLLDERGLAVPDLRIYDRKSQDVIVVTGLLEYCIEHNLHVEAIVDVNATPSEPGFDVLLHVEQSRTPNFLPSDVKIFRYINVHVDRLGSAAKISTIATFPSDQDLKYGINGIVVNAEDDTQISFYYFHEGRWNHFSREW